MSNGPYPGPGPTQFTGGPQGDQPRYCSQAEKSKIEHVHEKTNNLGFRLSLSQTTEAVRSQKQARNFKFRIQEEVRLYYQCSENKGADLHHWFLICKVLVFSCIGSNIAC